MNTELKEIKMYQENYKGFEINELYDEQQKPYYNIAKVFKDDPYYEIWPVDYQTIDDAKKAIDNSELPDSVIITECIKLPQ